MARFACLASSLVLLFAAGSASAAGQRDIDTAIAKGASYLKARYAKGATDEVGGVEATGIGPVTLAGIAMLEAKVPANDPSMQIVIHAVRAGSYTQHRTYQIALCLIFLDRLEEPSDVPLIQMLAARLLVGQNGQGGWTYECLKSVPDDHARWLKTNLKVDQLVAGKDVDAKAPPSPKNKPIPKMHPDVVTYLTQLVEVRRNENASPMDDNSNTQFGVLGIWVSRKHGVPVEAALDLIEKRFRATQDARTGGWIYMAGMQPTPSMTCCGLLGLATANARRATRPEAPSKDLKPTKEPKPNDPFFTETPAKAVEAKKPAIRDPAAQRALDGLGAALSAYVRNGGLLGGGSNHGDRDLYFLWSVERVGVIYGLDKIGDVDWYEVGSDILVKVQAPDGAWNDQRNYGTEVNTSFALLFLCKADLARDLSSKFRNGKDNELRAGTSGATPAGSSGNPSTAPMPKTPGNPGTKPLPSPVEDEAAKLANQLVSVPATDWTKALEKMRDAKGGDFTKSLVLAIHRLDGERKKDAREALAERLTRMAPDTLKVMTTAEDAELRRGAVLACAMKDDKVHVPDLIDRLTDDDEIVIRAAKAGLKSLTSQDFGPKPGATKDECKVAATAWRAWWSKQK